MKSIKNLFLAILTVVCVAGNGFNVFADTEGDLRIQIEQLQNELERYREISSTDSRIEGLYNQINSLNEQLLSSRKSNATPKVKLQTPTLVTIKGGTSRVVELQIKNISSSSAEHILTQATVAGTIPFTLEFVDNSNTSYSLNSGNTKKIDLKIVTDKDAASGTYPITLTHNFRNEYGVNATETDTLNIKVENDTAAASVILHTFTGSKETINPNNTFTVEGILENTSTQNAKDVQILIEGLKAGEISFSGMTNSIYYKEMGSKKSEKISLNLEASSKIKKGTYPLTFKVKYKDMSGKDFESIFYYYVNVSGTSETEEKASVEIKNVVSPTATMGVGETFKIKMDVEGTGSTLAKNIKITAETDTEGAVVPKSANVIQIKELSLGETKEISFDFAATAKSKSQYYTIGFTVEYETGQEKEDDTKEVEKFSQYVGANISNPDADTDEDDEDEQGSVPKIIISKYASDPVIVKAGQEFALSITFKNTHKDKTIENVKAYFTTVEDTTEKKGSVFVPVNASNTFYIDKIAPKGEVEENIRFYTIPDALPKNYIIGVNFEYEYGDKHTEYKSVEQFGINVKQVTKLETYNLNVPTESFVGQQASVYFDLSNTGKVTLSNLMVRLEGDFDTENSVSYYSNFTAGNMNSYEGTFTPLEPGPQKGKIIITYEDDTGEKIEEIKEFDLNVIGGNMGMPEGMMMEGDMMARPDVQMGGSGGFNFKSPWFIGGATGGVALIAVIGFFIRQKIKNKQKGLDFDE